MPGAEPRWGAHLVLSDPVRGAAFFCPASCVAGCWISLHPAGDDLEPGTGWDDYSMTEAQLYRVLRRGDFLDVKLLPLPSGRVRCQLRHGFYACRDLSWALTTLGEANPAHPRSGLPCRQRGMRSRLGTLK